MNWLILFRPIITVYCKHHTKHTTALYGQDSAVFALCPFVGHLKVNGHRVACISELYGEKMFWKTGAEFVQTDVHHLRRQ
jgi:hypothetical protein